MESQSLTTVAEKSSFQSTGRSDEVKLLCDAFQAKWPTAVCRLEFGESAEGRPMHALLACRTDPMQVPLLMIQAGIHPGESDGKDAGFIALREILSELAGPGVLDQMGILFVPALNIDGHERFGRWNRPNQNGPVETGWRTTAQNLNLNRDYTKADAPEMRALLGLIRDFDPLICADLHVTDGADFQPDLSLQTEPVNQGDPQMRGSGRAIRDQLIARMTSRGSKALPFYPDLVITDDPSSGFLLTVYSPRFSTGYFPQRNRFTVLVETHSWKDYGTRVRVTRDTIVELAQLVAAHGGEWRKEAVRADASAALIGGTDVELDFMSGWREGTSSRVDVGDASSEQVIEFPGYAYTRKPSAFTGELVTDYDPTTPQIWRVPFRSRVTASLVVKAPLAGYVVPCGWAKEIGAHFGLHGIRFSVIAVPRKQVATEVFRAAHAEFAPAPFEGRTRVSLRGAWTSEFTDICEGMLFVSIAQPLSRLVMHLLEPQAPDSLAAWGFFNGCFEQKEYFEPYVAEKMALEVLARLPHLQDLFAQRLRDDANFAASPAQRLDFFLRYHASWDAQLNRYPICRVDESLA